MPSHSSKPSLFSLVNLRRRLVPCAVAAALAATLAVPAAAQSADATEPLRLRSATELQPAAPPARAPAPGTSAARAARPQRPTLGLEDETERGIIFLRADRLEGVGQKEVSAEGNVELRGHRETVLADRLVYDIQNDEVHATGNVVLRKGIDWITGSELVYKRDTQTGAFTGPVFHVGESGARGDASKLTFAGPERYDVTDGRYTTCVAPRQDWFLETRELEIDQQRQVGTARDATVRFFGAPIFYSPWIEFPLNNERKSGFLIPTAGSSGARGIEFALPYYFNLAPNYDATVTPRIMSKRGLQLGGQFRYLLGDDGWQNGGEADAQVLNDRQTDSTRYALVWRHQQQLGIPGLGAYLDLNKVSDDKYFADLADRIAITSQTTLPREAGITYGHGPWSLLARVQTFQTLQDPNAPIVPPYFRVPQIVGTLAETDWMGLTFSGFGDYSRFRSDTQVEGGRLVLYPQIAFKRSTPGWFFAARTGIHLRRYDLDPQPGVDDLHRSLAIPISSIDAGLVFERDWTLFGTTYTHTFEPRAYYVYIPFHEQNSLPVFDSAIDDYNFGQLFTENRYLGNDRIGDANQLTIGVTSRLLQPGTGAERLRVALAQRFYFEDQRVTLNEVPRSASSSDILLAVEGRISEAWAVAGLLQQNLDRGQNERFNLAVRYTPSPGTAVSASYRFTRQLFNPDGTSEQLKQVDLAVQWPVTPQWTILGRYNYSLADRKLLEGIVGVEYNGDCWVLRAVLHRLATTVDQTNTSFFIQLELNGLARVGTSPLDLLRRSVPGYVPVNDPLLMQRDRTVEPLPDF